MNKLRVLLRLCKRETHSMCWREGSQRQRFENLRLVRRVKPQEVQPHRFTLATVLPAVALEKNGCRSETVSVTRSSRLDMSRSATCRFRRLTNMHKQQSGSHAPFTGALFSRFSLQ